MKKGLWLWALICLEVIVSIKKDAAAGCGSGYIGCGCGPNTCDVCLDLDNSCQVEPSDFLTVVTGVLGANTSPCVDGGFCADGYTDSYDIESLDWFMNDNDREEIWCGQPVPLSTFSKGLTNGFDAFRDAGELLDLSDLNDLLISGKRGTTDSWTKLKDRLYVFDSNNQYIQYINLASERCNIRIVRGKGNDLYQINSESGVSLLEIGMQIVPPGQTTFANEPRYNRPATIYAGIQGIGGGSFGRPILDASFDANFVYVVPVVVAPDTNEPYTAAAKLQLDSNSNPPYHIVKLYDGPILPSDGNGQYRNTLREIEIDSAGNIYVTNAHKMNASDILWKFEPNGAVHRLDLDLIDPCVPAPTGMCVSNTTNVLYLASSLYNEADPNLKIIYGFSTEDFNLDRTITISGINLITSITEDPITNSLWVVGFTYNSIPTSPIDPFTLPFYDPYLANVPIGINNVSAVRILNANHPEYDLAMPLSVVWTGTLPELCGGADLDKNGEVSLPDLAKLAQYWLNTNCVSLNNCEGADLEPQAIPDGDVDLQDLDILAEHWLKTGCLGP